MKLDDLEKIEFPDNSRLSFDHDLSRLNWFNIGGKSKIYLFANSLKDLSLFLNKYNNRGKNFYFRRRIKYFILMIFMME